MFNMLPIKWGRGSSFEVLFSICRFKKNLCFEKKLGEGGSHLPDAKCQMKTICYQHERRNVRKSNSPTARAGIRHFSQWQFFQNWGKEIQQLERSLLFDIALHHYFAFTLQFQIGKWSRFGLKMFKFQFFIFDVLQFFIVVFPVIN